ncbi:hypothetical protein [Thermus antranikianii]
MVHELRRGGGGGPGGGGELPPRGPAPKPLLELLEGVEGEVEVALLEGRLLVRGGPLRAELHTAPPFSLAVLEGVGEEVFRAGEDFLKALRSALALGRHLTSYQGKVLVEVEEPRVRVAATDGYRLHLYTVRAEVFREGAYPLPAQAEEALKGLEGEVSFRLAWDGRALVAVGRDGRAGLPLAEGGFPSYRNVLPQVPPVGRIGAERKNLLEALKRALVVAAPQNHPVRLQAGGGEVRVQALDEAWAPVSEEVLPGEGDGEVTVDGRFLKEALEEVEGEEADLALYPGPRAPLVEVRDGRFYALIAGLSPSQNTGGQG